MNLIAAVDKNWGIGYRGELLAHIRADMKHFAALTAGGVVILGSKTLSTFPGGKPLKNRTNIILSRRVEFEPCGAVVVRSEAELFSELTKYDTDEVFVIGGASVYSLLLPYCERAYITEIDKAFEADAFIPNLAMSDEWQLSYRGEKQISDSQTDSEGGLRFELCEYRRRFSNRRQCVRSSIKTAHQQYREDSTRVQNKSE